jgi:hypothetical protein
MNSKQLTALLVLREQAGCGRVRALLKAAAQLG